LSTFLVELKSDTNCSADWVKNYVESSTKGTVHLIEADLEQPDAPNNIVKSHIDKVPPQSNLLANK